ncbi:lebercilin-like protein isoform X2 [Macrotis lagotis]|uniref:lebercilin-like protein isoform X2 n=1 Tax=Macrotis lagotis TaxID=92651 RepID=UPI003D69115B
MALIDATKTNVDDHFLHAILEDSSKPAECNRSLGTGDFSRNSNNSIGSIDYSRTQSRNFSSHCDYSEDFISEYSEMPCNDNCLELFETKVKKEEKKKKNVCKVSQHKGFKEISPEKLQNWNTALTSQINIITQRRDAMAHRIMSARLHKIKELKNELADIHRKLEATLLENQLLKRLQFRHLKAIGKYENSQNNLPQLMSKHQSEVKNLRNLLRKSQEKERNVSRKLRDTDSELLKTKDSLLTLQKLSEDKNLAEREELTQKLSTLTTKMEINDKKIQSLERQLKLNSNAFNRQLAAENRKTVTATTATKNLQLEVKRLQQKLKEKDRELDIKNIYTHRFLKNVYDKDEQTKVSPLTKSIQTEKKNHLFPHLLPHQLNKTAEDTIILPTKEEKPTRNYAEKEKLIDVKSEVVVHDINKLPTEENPEKMCKEDKICSWKMEAGGTTQNLSDIQASFEYCPNSGITAEKENEICNWKLEAGGTTQNLPDVQVVSFEYCPNSGITTAKEDEICNWKMEAGGTTQNLPDIQVASLGYCLNSGFTTPKDVLTEDRHQEVQTPLKSNGRQREKKEDLEDKPNLLKEEQVTSAKIEYIIPPLGESNQHHNVEKEKLKTNISMHDIDDLHNKYVIQNSRIPLRQRKHYSFSEATVNLHNGIPTSGTSHLSTICNTPVRNKQQGNTIDLKTENSISRYEPSFGKSSKTKVKESSGEKNGNCVNTTLRDKKSNLMEELFGSGYVLKNNPPNADLKSSNAEKESLENDSMHDPHNYQSTTINPFGDPKYATITYNSLYQNNRRKNSSVTETDEGNLKRSNKTRK